MLGGHGKPQHELQLQLNHIHPKFNQQDNHNSTNISQATYRHDHYNYCYHNSFHSGGFGRDWRLQRAFNASGHRSERLSDHVDGFGAGAAGAGQDVDGREDLRHSEGRQTVEERNIAAGSYWRISV